MPLAEIFSISLKIIIFIPRDKYLWLVKKQKTYSALFKPKGYNPQNIKRHENNLYLTTFTIHENSCNIIQPITPYCFLSRAFRIAFLVMD